METKLVFSVSEITRLIKDTLECQYPDIWVEGEISNLRIPSSGHCYLTLKDEKSQLRAVMFRFKSRLLRFAPEDGLKVICRGRINVYEPRGEYQLLIEMMEPKGIGDLQLAYEQLKKKLQQEGLFDGGRKKPLPFMPERVAVLTSPTGAAVRDIINIIRRRFPSTAVTVVPVRVQGEEAPDEIAAALALANRFEIADVIIVGRGGGSLEDLWAFNTETVARAVFGSKIPVVSAVGHEIDYTICDFTADLRAPTPSSAAELVVPDQKELKRLLGQMLSRLLSAQSAHIRRLRTSAQHSAGRLRGPANKIADLQLRHGHLHVRLLQALPRFLRHKGLVAQNACQRILSLSPAHAVSGGRTRCVYLRRGLLQLMRAAMEKKAYRLDSAGGRLQALNPQNILERGFSITRQLPSMDVVRDAAQVRQGDTVQVRLGKGEIECDVRRVSA